MLAHVSFQSSRFVEVLDVEWVASSLFRKPSMCGRKDCQQGKGKTSLCPYKDSSMFCAKACCSIFQPHQRKLLPSFYFVNMKVSDLLIMETIGTIVGCGPASVMNCNEGTDQSQFRFYLLSG